MAYSCLILTLILTLTTTRMLSVTAQSWVFSPPSLQTVDIYNGSALNVSWQYSSLETEPSIVRLSINIYGLKPVNLFRTVFIIDGQDRFNYTSKMIVNSDFLISNAYYGIVLEYNTTYNYGANRSQQFWGRSQYRLIKMANTSIPSEQIKTDITATSVVVSLMWPVEIPYFKLETNVKLDDVNTSLPIETVSNETYLVSKYQFQNLQPETVYSLSTTFKRRYLPNDDWTVSVQRTTSIRTLPESGSESGSTKLAYQQISLFSIFNILFFNLFSSKCT